MNLSSR